MAGGKHYCKRHPDLMRTIERQPDPITVRYILRRIVGQTPLNDGTKHKQRQVIRFEGVESLSQVRCLVYQITRCTVDDSELIRVHPMSDTSTSDQTVDCLVRCGPTNKSLPLQHALCNQAMRLDITTDPASSCKDVGHDSRQRVTRPCRFSKQDDESRT